MRKRNEQNIYERLNLSQKDFAKIGLLFAFSFSLGLFVAFYFVPSNSEFLENVGTANLPLAYFLSGVVGYLSTSLYSFIQKKTKKSKLLFLIAIIFMLIISLLSRFGLTLFEIYKTNINHEQFILYQKFLSFFVFIWAWPIISLVAMITGGLVIRLLNLMQVKKYFGLINIGGVVASIIGYFLIPFFLKYLTHQYDLIVIGTVGLIISLILISVIFKKFPENKGDAKNEIKNENKEENKDDSSEYEAPKNESKNETSEYDNVPENDFWKLLKKKFIIFIFISAALSTIAIYISDYGFLVAIKNQQHIFNNKQEVSLFLSIVFGGLKIGELILSILSSRILSRWGVKLGLVIMPLSITILLILAYLSETFFGLSSVAFLFFITLNKSLERILRRGLDDPAFNVLYQTLPEKQKLFVQTRVGVVIQFSIAIAGAILLLITNLLTENNVFNLQFYPIFVLPLIIFWAYVTFNLYKLYKEKIRQILAEKKMFKINLVGDEVFGSQILEKHLLGEDINAAKFSIVVLSETYPRSLEAYANFLLKVDDKLIRKMILKNIDPTYNERISKTIEQIGNNINFKERELHKLILTSLYHLDYTEIVNISEKELGIYINSSLYRDKIKLTKYLFKNQIENDEEIILNLLESEDKAIKLAAIKIASRRKTKALLIKLVEIFKLTEYNNLLINIFVEIGNDIIPFLDKYFEEKTEPSILLKIIEIYAKIGFVVAENCLILHINYPDREIQTAIITALYYCEYTANAETIPIIKDKIIEVAENILWFLVSIKDIESQKNTLKLMQSLDLEKEICFELLFNLLSFIHPPETIDLIKTNIIGENTIFALEIIENFVSKDIKQIIIPLFDKISVSQRIRKLKPYFYYPELGFYERLKDIILKDYRKVDIWTQTKALELFGKLLKKNGNDAADVNIKLQYDDNEMWTEENAREILKLVNKDDIPDELFVALYHNAELVYSTAAKVIYEHSPIMCINYLKNLSPQKQKLIDILSDTEAAGVLLDRVKLLKRIFLFFTVPEKSLVKLATLINAARKKKGDKVYFKNKNGSEDIIILIKGNLIYSDKKNGDINFLKNDIIIKGLHVPQQVEEVDVDKNAYLVFINRFEYFNLLVTDKQIIHHLFNRMKF